MKNVFKQKCTAFLRKYKVVQEKNNLLTNNITKYGNFKLIFTATSPVQFETLHYLSVPQYRERNLQLALENKTKPKRKVTV